MKRMLLCTSICILVFLMLLSGCSSESGNSKLVMRSLTSAEEYRYLTLDWLNDNTVVVTYSEERDWGESASYELRTLSVNNGDLGSLNITDGIECARTNRRVPTKLEDGRLAYVAECIERGRTLYLMAFDPIAGTTEYLHENALPIEHIGTGGFAWDTDKSVGLMGSGAPRLVAEQLYRLTPSGASILDLGLEQAFDPKWSSASRLYAFVGSEEEGQHLDFDQPYTIYLLSEDFDQMRPLIDTRGLPTMVWSADGKYLLVNAKIQSESSRWQKGLWVIDVDTGEVTRITSNDAYVPAATSPNGEWIVATEYLDDNRQRVVLISTEGIW